MKIPNIEEINNIERSAKPENLGVDKVPTFEKADEKIQEVEQEARSNPISQVSYFEDEKIIQEISDLEKEIELDRKEIAKLLNSLSKSDDEPETARVKNIENILEEGIVIKQNRIKELKEKQEKEIEEKIVNN